MTHPLMEMQKLGQSPWHDNIRRDLLTSGKLAKMVADQDITGLTSNPTIFEQAIAKSTDYDDAIRKLATAGKSPDAIFDTLALEDIRAAADVFAPVYAKTGGKDGFVSIEVAPKYANDTEATVREAHRLFEAAGKKNCMVKIPATLEGLPAIERAIADGININVTLIFSLERYDKVMDAYIAGLEKHAAKGWRLDGISSVASFFVSRVDSAVDKLLDAKIASAAPSARAELEVLLGKAAIANAKVAYEAFKKKFSSPRFSALKAKGANVQRPLWASTSTKNPAYPDVYYVEALIGPDTVDTLPPATIVAFKDHGKAANRLEQGLAESKGFLERIARAGIDMNAVTKKLEVEGVASFAASYDSLMKTVAERRQQALAK